MQTVLLYLLGIVVVLVGVAVSIGLHEIGHLVPAKLFGVKVGQYMVGFGPTIFSRKKGETEYGVKAIPLGGYISMAGMYPPARPGGAPLTSGTDAFPLENEYESGGRRESFFRAMVQDARSASAATVTPGDENRVFYKLAIWKRIIIMLGGPFMNLVIAVVLFGVVLSGIGILGSSTTIASVSACVLPSTTTRTVCAADDPVAPAAEAGIRPGDTIVSINGSAISSWAQATTIIRASAEKSMAITVRRDGKTLDLRATPALTVEPVRNAAGAEVKNSAGVVKTTKVGILGVSSDVRLQQQPLTTVIPTVGTNIGADFGLIANLPSKLVGVAKAAFGTGARDPNGPISVVGVGRIAGEITATQSTSLLQRLSFLLGLIASLNVALFAFNMVPLLPLDGGHIFGALYEGVRRFFARLFKRRDPGPVDIAKLVPLTFGVVIVLGAMSVLLIYADIVKPVSLQ